MAERTITIEGPAREALASALLSALGEHAEQLSAALSAHARDHDTTAVGQAYRRLNAIAALAERMGWRPVAASSVTIELEGELPIVLAALRSELEQVEELAADAKIHGDAQEIAFAAQRAKATREALGVIEEQAKRGRG